jgi:hypothetical protein
LVDAPPRDHTSTLPGEDLPEQLFDAGDEPELRTVPAGLIPESIANGSRDSDPRATLLADSGPGPSEITLSGPRDLDLEAVDTLSGNQPIKKRAGLVSPMVVGAMLALVVIVGAMFALGLDKKLLAGGEDAEPSDQQANAPDPEPKLVEAPKPSGAPLDSPKAKPIEAPKPAPTSPTIAVAPAAALDKPVTATAPTEKVPPAERDPVAKEKPSGVGGNAPLLAERPVKTPAEKDPVVKEKAPPTEDDPFADAPKPERRRPSAADRAPPQLTLTSSPDDAEDPKPVGKVKGGPGQLTLVTEPYARVMFKAQDLGVTPLFKVNLPPGKHILRLIGPDQRAVLLPVDIKEGTVLPLRISLSDLEPE